MRPDTSYINALRFPLAVLVVLIHALNAPWREYFAASESVLCQNVAESLAHIIPAFAVPLFFMISGYLFFFGSKDFGLNDYKAKLRRRVGTLVVPYLTWNALAALLYLFSGKAFPFSPSIFWGVNVVGTDGENVLGWTIGGTTGPVLLQLWFVRDLIILTLLSPAFYYTLRRLGLFGLLLIAAVYYVGLWPNPLGVSFKGFWFFAVGAYLSLSKVDVSAFVSRLFKPSLVCSVLLSFLLSFSTAIPPVLSGVLLDIYVFSGAITAVGFALLFCRSHTPRRLLSMSSFFLYASHTIVLLPLSRLAINLLQTVSSPAADVLLYLLCPTLSVVICVFAFFLLQRFLPRLSRPLTGLR